MKVLTNSQGKVLLNQQSKAYYDPTPYPATLEIGATTVHTSASTTENIASNDNIRILGSDNHKYTIAQWNAMYVAAGYDRTQMSVTPVGISVDAFDNAGESYMFDRYTGITYNTTGITAGAAGKLQHFIYNSAIVTGAGSGTDYTTSKGWTVTVDGDNLILAEANTGCSWTVSKNCAATTSHKAFNVDEITYYHWAYNEWMRHRFAISSGVTTTAADKTMGEVAIFNSSGTQAAANEDMYFWVRATSSDSWQNTNVLAKYNPNNLHNTNSALLTSAIADAIYGKQKENGIDMNDTGVNSSSKPILAPGCKGAEAIAVNGYWYIITPFISNPNSTAGGLSGANYNSGDSPAVYWAINKGFNLPSDTLLYAIYMNKTLFDAAFNYLKNKEGWALEAIPSNDYIWSAVRVSASGAWNVNLSYGYLYYGNTFTRYYSVGAVAS